VDAFFGTDAYTIRKVVCPVSVKEGEGGKKTATGAEGTSRSSGLL